MNDYRINLYCWHDEIEVGGAVRWGKYPNNEAAKQAAREMWKNYHPETVKQIKIYDSEGIQIFEHNNFKEFA